MITALETGLVSRLEHAYLLNTPQGELALSNHLAITGGRAFALVHPSHVDLRLHSFFDNGKTEEQYWEKTGESPDVYSRYQGELLQEVERAKQDHLPILFFQAQSFLSEMPELLKKLGLQNQNVFVIPTEQQDPKPVDGSLRTLSKKLLALGLHDLTVAGTYLYRYQKSSFWIPGKTFIDYEGCVGVLMKRLNKKGINTHLGMATYPAAA